MLTTTRHLVSFFVGNYMATVNKHTVVELKPYPPVLALAFDKQQHDSLQQEFKCSDFGYFCEDELDRPVATTFCLSRSNRPFRLLIIELYRHDMIDVSTLAHEAVHVMSYLMEYVGLKYDPDNDEWYAYMIGYIVDEINNAYTAYKNSLNAHNIASEAVLLNAHDDNSGILTHGE